MTTTTPPIHNTKKNNGHLRSTKLILELHAQIWKNRNQHIHGQTQEEARTQAREAVIKWVTDLYHNPPCLAPCFLQITALPLMIYLSRTTKQLQDWLHWVEHQQRATAHIESMHPRTANDTTGLSELRHYLSHQNEISPVMSPWHSCRGVSTTLMNPLPVDTIHIGTQKCIKFS